MRNPTSSVKVRVVLLEAAVLGHHLLGLEVFVGVLEGGVQSGSWVPEGIVGCRY